MGLVADVVSIGVDLGIRHDFTAISAARITERPTGGTVGSGMTAEPEMQTFYDVRYPQRLPNGTSFQQVGRRLVELVGKAHELPPVYDEYGAGEMPRPYLTAKPLPREVLVTIDATGLGLAALEIIARELEREGVPTCKLIPVMITSGMGKTAKTYHEGGRYYSGYTVGKSRLVSRLSALMQPPVAIGLPRDHPDIEEIIREVHDFKITVGDGGQESFGAPETTGSHDDYVTALALSVLHDPAEHRVTYVDIRLF